VNFLLVKGVMVTVPGVIVPPSPCVTVIVGSAGWAETCVAVNRENTIITTIHSPKTLDPFDLLNISLTSFIGLLGFLIRTQLSEALDLSRLR
jgi:hypothetical protein